ncbi:zinc finger protein 219 [Denticeps clupeoides]|uniref:zinc finger protein 219 n=1 Tax=Denticeps clupeoides TaxID=299321 RepID=UPI0010A36175|nr:zinc finger protein 219 [Denticeps clupeoides]
MNDRSRLPSGGRGEPALAPSPVQRDSEARRARARDQSDAVSSTPVKVKREDISDVPRKVPKFQYVDFPSLHQCIQQLTVPPLESWLAGCPMRRPSGHAPASPKERVPKFQYVDYPSLYHCIQQLSVPPVESWSPGLAGGAAVGERRPSQHGSAKEEPEGQRRRRVSGQNPGPNATSFKPPPTRQGAPSQTTTTRSTKDEEAEPRTRLDTAPGARDRQRVSVISLHPGLKPNPSRPQPPARRSGGSSQAVRSAALDHACPFCQKMFADPEELKIHHRTHRDQA